MLDLQLTPKLPRGVLNGDYQAMIHIHDLIIAKLNQPMQSVDSLAKSVNMSSTKFRELFKKMYGHSIYHYHLVARLQLAQEFLVANDYTVSQIAYKVGFSHPPAFIHIFKKHYGVFPLAFRERSLQQEALLQL
jgi:AraC-like DNA-binding protein